MNDEQRISPFEFVKAINSHSDPVEEGKLPIEVFNPFMVMMICSFREDGIFQCQEMNKFLFRVPNLASYYFMKGFIKPRRLKREEFFRGKKRDSDLKFLIDLGWSPKKAEEILEIVTADELDELRRRFER